MSRDRATETAARTTALRRYMWALEHGNLDVIAAIVQHAETDATLERMLLDVNEEYMQQQDSIPGGEMGSADADRTAKSDLASPLHAEREQGVWSARRSLSSRPRWLSTFAAVLALVAVLSGFIAVFWSRGISESSQKVPTPPPVIQSEQPTEAPGVPMIFVGNWGGLVAAVRTETGAVAWRWNGHTVDSLAQSAGTIYIASHPGANDGDTSMLTALRASDGAKIWQVREPQLAGHTYMAVDGDMLLVASGYGDGTIYALDARTGKTRWSQPGVAVGLTQRLITSTQGVTYVSNVGGGFNAYDARSGKFLWRNGNRDIPEVPSGNNGPPIVAGSEGLTYYYNISDNLQASQNAVLAFASTTGTIQQRLTVAEIGDPLLVTANGIVYTTKDSQLCAFSIADSNLLWCDASITGADSGTEFGLRLVSTSSALLYSRIINDRVEVGALDNSTGRRIWSWRGPATLYSATNSMSLSGNENTLFLSTRNGIYAFQASTGKATWHALAGTDLSFVQPALAG